MCRALDIFLPREDSIKSALLPHLIKGLGNAPFINRLTLFTLGTSLLGYVVPMVHLSYTCSRVDFK